jgi:DNA-binding transcriptional MerR regulator
MRHQPGMDRSPPPQTAESTASTEGDPMGPRDQTSRIGEMASEFGVTLRTLRFYEDKGLLNPQRIGVTRLYSRRDRARLKLILLGKRLGFSLEEVKKMIELYDPHGKNETQLRVALEKGEMQLERLSEQRREIDLAIGELERTLDLVREMLRDGG